MRWLNSSSASALSIACLVSVVRAATAPRPASDCSVDSTLSEAPCIDAISLVTAFTALTAPADSPVMTTFVCGTVAT
ncbi:MAG TPA: hypothetical protein PK752_11325 [Accumulibacter sp.]|uniref:hypothetical protein n=1 Tax=Accumulibacter sp. TaxID=2053492 RepID=UPI002C84081E|nr:hypothetical protein [Accumulibacter sp.]HRD88826.1 hypothetical protein [Accumulibacter sp.]